MSALDPLREVSTFRLDSGGRKYSLDLQAERLPAKLSAGDIVAQYKYHPRCLLSLQQSCRLQDEGQQDGTDKVSRDIALAELMTY